MKAGEEPLPQSDESDLEADKLMDHGRERDIEEDSNLVPIAKNAVSLVESSTGRMKRQNETASKHEINRPPRPKIDTHTAPFEGRDTAHRYSNGQDQPQSEAEHHCTPGTPRSRETGSTSKKNANKGGKSPSIKDSDSVAISPLLRKYTIPNSQGAPTETLPAMQNSPPPSSSRSPRAQQKLPSLSQIQLEPLMDTRAQNEHPHGITRAAFPVANGGVSSPSIGSIAPRPSQAPSPRMQMMNGGFSRSSFPYGQPSPANSDASPRDSTAMSPPGKPVRHGYYSNGRTPQNEELTPQSADSQRSGSSFSTAPSPHHISPHDRPTLPPMPGLSNGPTMGGSHKCEHPGCNAPPFQTQYLLK
ncbi:hypothetical protein MMC21_000262 [Puttea exsequens]|nr:hypothetical protein [Puttea exsequens]